jgi:hypothetical protein
MTRGDVRGENDETFAFDVNGDIPLVHNLLQYLFSTQTKMWEGNLHHQ